MKCYKLETVEDYIALWKRVTKENVPVEKLTESILEMREEMRQKALSQIPEMYKDAELSSFGYIGDEIVDALKEVFSSVDGSKKGILLTGPTGSGKTYAMWAMWKWIAERDPSRCVFFENYAKYMQRIRDEFMNNSYQEQGSWWDITTNGKENHGVVMIDDVGTSKFSDFELEKLYLLLDERTSNYEPLILSTNIDNPNFLVDHFGNRISSRLNYLKHITFPNSDLRVIDNETKI